MREHSCVDRVERLLAELWWEKDGGGKAAQNGRRQPLREARPLRTRACLSVIHAHRTCTRPWGGNVNRPEETGRSGGHAGGHEGAKAAAEVCGD